MTDTIKLAILIPEMLQLQPKSTILRPRVLIVLVVQVLLPVLLVLYAAAAYLGLSKGNKDTEPSDTAYSGAFKENQTSTLSKNAPTREVPASSYNEGQLKGLKDELYQAGYNQGKDIYAGIDKNSTKHRDALIAGNSDGKGDNVNRSLDPSSTSSSGSSADQRTPKNKQKQLLLLLVVSVLLDTVRVLQKEQMLQLVMLTWLVKVEKLVTMTEAK